MFAYYCADIKAYFPYLIGIQGCNKCLALFIYSEFVYDVALILAIFSELCYSVNR